MASGQPSDTTSTRKILSGPCRITPSAVVLGANGPAARFRSGQDDTMTTSALVQGSHGFASVTVTLVAQITDAAMAVVQAYRHRLDATTLAGADDQALAD